MKSETKQGMQEMEELLSKVLWSHLQSLGLFKEKSAVLTDLREQARISISYERWLLESIRLLTQQHYLHIREHVTCTVVDPTLIESTTIWQEWDERKEHWMQNADLKAQVMLVETMLHVLPAILTGKRPATEVMFPKGSTRLVEGIYQHNAIADFFNEVLATLVVTCLQEWLSHEGNARIRILEIGAGTGGTTSRVLQMLQPYQASIEEYCYSDVSDAFLHYGERMYAAEHPYLTYRHFNVEKPLTEQGIQSGSYDLVIAANVLHATSDIRRTVRNAKAALKKHGLLFLNEITGTSIFTHLTFGLLSGWWAYEDPELRMPGCPALTTENWQMVLSDEGFGPISIPTRDIQEASQQIIVAESDGIVRQQHAHPEEIRRDSALRLSAPHNTRASQPEIRRDSALCLSAPPSPQTSFPHNNGGTTDQIVKDHVQSILLESMAEVLKIDQRYIEDDISFSEYGVDSIVAVNLINVINQKSHLSLQTTVLFDNNNLEQLLHHILREDMTTLKASLVEHIQETLPIAQNSGYPAQNIKSNSQWTRFPLGHAQGQRMPSAPSSGGTDCQPMTLERASGINDLTTRHEPIAIIGMSGQFARSKTVSELWEHLANGTDLIEEVSRWDLADLSPESGEKTEPYCKHGSFLEEIDSFDPLFFNISRHEAAYMDPQQRLVLEEAWKALEDAGYVGTSIEGCQCGVYMGCVPGDYPDLFGDMPPAQAFWGNAGSVIPARIAYYLNLQGPAIAIDTACSSSLVAMHLACQSLWSGETEMALAGGVFLQCTPRFYQSANRAGMLSLTGRCSTFDERADGFVPGEGVGIVVLKRLKDAEAAGDHIYGVIRGSGINQDGTTRGITVPSANSQERLLRSVYETFQIEPSQIQMVEAHGTGTQLGDPIEYEALTRAFRKYTEKKEYCALGSIKTNLGHTAAAAGVAGVIKILLSLQHKQIPPSLHFQSGNAHIQFKGSPFYVNTRLKDWSVALGEADGTGSAQGTIPTRRCAAISSFGFSGTNAHIVIEEASECTRRHAQMPGYLIVLSARTPAQLRQQVEQLVAFCECTAGIDCGNMSYTLLLGRKHLKHRLACVVRNHKELAALLRKWLEKGKVPQISVSNLENWEQREIPSLKRYANQCIEDCRSTTQAETYLEQLSTVADLYLQGYTLAFEQLFAGNGYARISLPTYPFARERCWADKIVAQPDQWSRKDSVLRIRADTLREALAHIVSQILQVRIEEIDAETAFSEYGFDSITFVEFADRLNQTYQLDLKPTLFYEHSTLGRLTQYLHATYASLLDPHFATVLLEIVPQKDQCQDKILPTALVAKQRDNVAHSFMPVPLAGTEPIAIIGMSGAFPQAKDVESLWHNLLEGRDCIGEIPASRWDWQTSFGHLGSSAELANIKWAGVIEGIETFDPLFFGISKVEAEQMDPQQRLLMIYVWKAIEDAGYTASSLSGTNTALFVGTGSSGYSERVFHATMTIEDLSSTGLVPSTGPNRMSYFLNLHGPSEPVDTACSSSLVAIHRGVNAIESGACTMAIVGGVNTLISPELHLSVSKAGMLSPDGRCKAFSAQANGYVRSEGVGMLVLKRLALAERDGDHIYGVIRSSAENHGGRASSFTAPNPRAQADLLITAYRKAGIDPRTVSYIEAHGTGTALGDPIEIDGLKTAWSELTQTLDSESLLPTVTCGIGTIKSNIGHLELAAGVAGVIKVLLQMQHKKLVKSLHCERLNPYIQLEGSPFYIVQENREWETLRDREGQALPRRAGVSSFGFGGVNAHVVLEEYVPKGASPSSTQRHGDAAEESRSRSVDDGFIPSPDRGQPYPPRLAPVPALIVLSAKNEERLREQVQQFLAWAQAERRDEDPLEQAQMLQDLAYTLQVGREAMEERLALQVGSLAELEKKLGRYLQDPQQKEGDWYRGQVKQYKEMVALMSLDEELQKVIGRWLQQGQYEKLLSWWVKGLAVDWKYLYTVGTGLAQVDRGRRDSSKQESVSRRVTTVPALPRRISLPTYPFARERYWIPASVVNPHGMSTRPLPASFDQTRTALLTPGWKEEAIAPLSLEQDASLPAEWLVLLCEFSDTLASRIQVRLGQGCRCRSLPVGTRTGAVGTGVSPVPTAPVRQPCRELHFRDAVVQLIQELQHLLRKCPVELVLVQVVVAHREEPSFLEALTGVLKTAQQEYPKLAGQLIEVDENVQEGDLLAWLHENRLCMPHASHIRYRDGKRWVREWQELAPATDPESLPWKEGGCYLISGGAGGLARLFVQEIARQVQEATVILLGRSALSVSQQAQLERVGQKRIHIDYQQVDVSDGPAVHSLIQRVLAQHGQLHGIIHAAGVLRDSLLLNKTPEEVRTVLAPKVFGVEHLDGATSEIPLDFFVLCSSLAAVAGNVGQADYAAANAYIDVFAHARQALVMAGQRQGATLSINWPYWETGGMQIEAETVQMMREQLGMEAMETETGIKILYQALASGLAQVIALHGQVERIKHLALNKSALSVKTSSVESTPDPERQVQLDTLCEALAHIVSRMLKVQVEEISAETAFSEYGFDSVTFVKFANHLNQIYQLDLTPALFYEHSTIERLAKYLRTTYAAVLATHFDTCAHKGSERTPDRDRRDSALCLSDPPLQAPATTTTTTTTTVTPVISATPIAIIGMSGVFPQARDVESLWHNLLEGRDCIGEIPASRWDWQTSFGYPDSSAGQTNIKWAGIIEDVETFDPQFFGISPREAGQMDPQQRLLMMYVWKAIEDAGYTASSLSGTNTALFVGTASSGYGERIFRAHMAIEGFSSTGLAPSIGPNRMSYFLDLHGPSEPIDTACSSSLVAIHRGVNTIESGACTMAIVGGVNTLISPEAHISASRAGMLSLDGRCKVFDASANGYVRSEGVGMLVLKKLALAEQDGDHIYGVIRGSAENHGGRASSLTAPNPRSQADLLITAYRKAGIDPRTVSYIEAHGTGTALGDPIEINGLKTAWSELTQRTGASHSPYGVGPVPTATCGIGTIKSNIGHLELASGVAGVIKVLLQMQHKKLVKSLHCERLNPYIQLEGSPFYIVQENCDWKALRDREGQALPRRAGVSSFGFGGSNAHVVLEEYVPKPRAMSSGRAQASALIVLSAKNEERLREQVEQFLVWAQAERRKEDPLEQAQMLQDLAYTLQVGREAMEERLALQVSSLAELTEKLRRYLCDSPHEGGDWYRGQVKQYKEMTALMSLDEELQKVIGRWLQQGQYEKLLSWWVKGPAVDWKYLYGEHLPRRISLPTYPFAREPYWVPTPHIDLMTLSSTSPSPIATVHPQSSAASPFPIAQHLAAIPSPQPEAGTSLMAPNKVPLRPLADRLTIGAVGTVPCACPIPPTNMQMALSVGIGQCTDPELAPQLEEELARSLAEALYMEQSAIDVKKPFGEIGLDSVTGVEWIQSLNKRYASHLKVSCVYDYPTIRQLAGFLQKELLQHQQTPVSPLSALFLDDILQKVQQRDLDPKQAKQQLLQLSYISQNTSQASPVTAEKEIQRLKAQIDLFGCSKLTADYHNQEGLIPAEGDH
jgi:acyl transferase domain-containing protein/2-polyprenyl-3-methyl-5-hydroxy-6-metoxy-1,4-benzoquinol methylase